MFIDLPSVRRYLSGRNIKIVPGNIPATAGRLNNEDLVCTFIGNETPARAAVEIVAQHTVIGVAIVFDHLTDVDRFRYTLGERLAARPLLSDPQYFHLHGTGVFYRQR